MRVPETSDTTVEFPMPYGPTAAVVEPGGSQAQPRSTPPVRRSGGNPSTRTIGSRGIRQLRLKVGGPVGNSLPYQVIRGRTWFSRNPF
jgi:hypothetical protein